MDLRVVSRLLQQSASSLYLSPPPPSQLSASRLADLPHPIMSTLSHVLPEQIGYVNCSFCNTILVVNVPSNNSSSIVAVKCGLCANILSVDLEAFSKWKPSIQSFQNQNLGAQYFDMDFGPPAEHARLSINSMDHVQQHKQLINPTEKRRVPSAYNRFIKEEIQRLKAKYPNITHKQAFSTAAKNWAHFPEIHFGLSINCNEQA